MTAAPDRVPRALAASRTPAAGHRWVRLVLRKVAEFVLVVAILTVGVAVLIRLLPGDPATAILGLNATPEQLAALRQQLGLDQPLWQQVLHQLGGVISGDLGTSSQRNQPVSELIAAAFPITLVLIVLSTIFAVVISVPIGLVEAWGARAWMNRGVRVTMVVLIAIPAFVIALYLLLFFGVQLKVAPAGGWGGSWSGAFQYLWLPSLALALFLIPLLVQVIMSSTHAVLSEEYVEAARSRGLGRSRIVFRHVLPNVLLPVITLVGFSASISLGAAVVIESVYGLPGFGSLVQNAVSSRDYPVVVGVTLVSGIFVVLVNMITDLLLAAADPRVRRSS